MKPPQQPVQSEVISNSGQAIPGPVSPRPVAQATNPLPPQMVGGITPEPPQQEADVWSGRTSWRHYAGRLSVWFVSNVAVSVALAWFASQKDWLTRSHVAWIVLAIFVITGLLVPGTVLLRIWATHYRLTTQRLFIERGILNRTIDQTELIRVDDVRLHKTFLDRVFGLGTIELITTDATDRDLTIDGIADPDRVAEGVRSRMRQLRSKSLFVENL